MALKILGEEVDVEEKLLEAGKNVAKTAASQVTPIGKDMAKQIMGDTTPKSDEEVKAMQGEEASKNPAKIEQVKQKLFQEAQSFGQSTAQQTTRPGPEIIPSKPIQSSQVSSSLTNKLTPAPEATRRKKGAEFGERQRE